MNRNIPATISFAILLLSTVALGALTTGTLTGRIVDAELKPIVGATVRLLGTTRGALSKAPDGRFTVTGVPAGTYEIEIRVIGYEKKTMSVKIDPDQTCDAGAVRMKPARMERWIEPPLRPRIVYRPGTVRTITADDLRTTPGN